MIRTDLELPQMVWVEVDLERKELPILICDSAEELARLCKTTVNNVKSAAAHAKYGKSQRRFLKVWIGDNI